jgi:phosphate transport system substrate-binding protein
MKTNSNQVDIIAISFFLCALLVFPAVVFAATSSELVAAGCKTEHFMLKDLSTAYQQKTGKSVRLGRTGNKKAVKMLLDNKVDFAFTCKPIHDLSKKFKLDNKEIANWESIPIGKDPIIVISNFVNGVDNLSLADLTRVFKGEVKNWKEVGGNDVPVKIGYLSAEIESGVVLLFREFTVGKNGKLDPQGVQLDDPVKIAQFVYSTPGAVGFLAHNSLHGDQSKVLSIDGVDPGEKNIRNGTYKLTATYYLTAPKQKNELVTDFIAFSRSKEGQEVVSKNFIPYTE